MSTSKLTLYNGALRFLGQSSLSSLTDDVEDRHVLDDVWEENARDHCLQQGNWNFAIRTIKIDYDSSVTPDFGFSRAFAKPSDWLRTVQMAGDEYFSRPLTEIDFVDEQGYWYADLEELYVRYVSNDPSYGYDLSLWPQSFVRYVEGYLAQQIAPRLIQALQNIDFIDKKVEGLLRKARSNDAMNEGAKFPPEGGWTRSRRGVRRERGSRSSLVG